MGCHALLQGVFPTQGSNPVSSFASRFLPAWATISQHKIRSSFLKEAISPWCLGVLFLCTELGPLGAQFLIPRARPRKAVQIDPHGQRSDICRQTTQPCLIPPFLGGFYDGGRMPPECPSCFKCRRFQKCPHHRLAVRLNICRAINRKSTSIRGWNNTEHISHSSAIKQEISNRKIENALSWKLRHCTFKQRRSQRENQNKH